MEEVGKGHSASWRSKALLLVMCAAGGLLFIVFEGLVTDLPRYQPMVRPQVGAKLQLSESDHDRVSAIVEQERVRIRDKINKLSEEIDSMKVRQRELEDRFHNVNEGAERVKEQGEVVLSQYQQLYTRSEEMQRLAKECDAKVRDGVSHKFVEEKCSQLPELSVLEAVKQEEEALAKLVEQLVAKTVALQSDTCTTRAYVDQKWEHYKAMKARDDVGLRDYALDEMGGKVVMGEQFTTATLTPKGQILDTDTRKSIDRFLNRPILGDHIGGPGLAISQRKSKGDCFAMEGVQGYLTVELAEPVVVGAVTLEHLNRVFSSHKANSAPREFKVYGYPDAEALNALQGRLLVEGSYDIYHQNAIQTFDVQAPIETKVAFVRLEISSNHQNENYTCLYRFRVHSLRDMAAHSR